MNKEDSIMEVVELVDRVLDLSFASVEVVENSTNLDHVIMSLDSVRDAKKVLKLRLRELLNETHQAGYEAGWGEADEAMSWNRSM